MDVSEPIYIEGIGTNNGVDDPFLGKADGLRGTGIVPKVHKGLCELIKKVESGVSRAGTKKIDFVHIDAFGFSRGAASARYFVYLAVVNVHWQVQKQLTGQGYEVGSVKVKFVGLFDTVAAFGLKHKNDTADLQLDSIRNSEKVVQLAAGEEHRANFRLTNINSAAGNGREIFLPGVHSDIGKTSA